VLVQNLRNLGQNILLEKRCHGVPRIGRYAHWHNVERGRKHGKAHQQMTLRYGGGVTFPPRRLLQSFDSGLINNIKR
jgi:hypothetical protein